MNKKLICLTLSILMLLACVFTSCSQEDKTGEGEASNVDNSAKTITLWMVTDEETDEKAKERVNEEFTKITKAKFKTNVVIKFCTEDEYYDKLESAIADSQAEIALEEQAAKALRQYLKAHKNELDENGNKKDTAQLTKEFYIANPQYQKFQQVEDEDEEKGPVEDETVINEDYGIVEIKYPDAKENQVDIFYLSGYDKYMEYHGNEWLSSLSEELNTSSKKLTDYISTSLLNGVQIEGGVYAIPNNVVIGEYTYMMIDKALFDRYFQKIDKVNSVLDLETFLKDVKYENGDKTPDDEGYIVPLNSTYEECLKMLCWYWDLSYVDRSVYETYYDETTGRNYVLKYEYKVTTETTDAEGNPVTKENTVIVDSVKPDVVYKTNAAGQYLDKDGNVLNYRYATDAEGGWKTTGSKAPVYDNTTAEAKNAMYLVDENGHAIAPEDDKRVEVDYETKTDSDGNARPTFYYSFNEEADFSILGSMMKNAAQRTRGGINLDFNSLFTDAEYREMYATLRDYEYQGYYGEAKEGQQAAVSFIKGDASIKVNYEKDGIYKDENGKEYYVVIAEYPEATEEELYGNMFAVYANSTNLARSMKVITYLNTNAELRNLFQYGVKGEHYEVNDDGTIHLLSNKDNVYRMDLKTTGNCFIATPDETMGADAWATVKVQNNDSLINPLLGFDFNMATADSDFSMDVSLIDYINKLNEETLELINECPDRATLESLMNDSDDGFSKQFSPSAGDKILNKATNGAYDPEAPLGPDIPDQVPDKAGSSPFAVYKNWQKTYGYIYTPTTED